MKKVGFYILYGLLWIISVFPLRVLYFFSDLTYLLVYCLCRYRVKTVRQNLRNSFPEKSDAERRTIERQFYHYLCDTLFESLHMLHMDEKAIASHIEFENIECLNQYALAGRNIFLVFGHFGNWEWVISLPIHIRKLINAATLYKTLHNDALNQFYLRLRSRYGLYCYSRKQVLRGIVELRKKNMPYLLAFIADQTPSINNVHYWTNFLNQDTPFLTGWAEIAHKQNEVVVYMHVQRTERGHYVCRFVPLSDNPKDEEPDSMVEKFARILEQNIIEQPAYWLWSHKRWKHKRTAEA